MNLIYRNASSYHRDNILTFLWKGDPSSRQRMLELEMKLRYGKKNDPERPPQPEKGDIYIVIGAAVGLIGGGALGAIIGNQYFSFLGGLFIGLIIGGLIGSGIGYAIKKRRQKTETNEQNPF